MSTTLETLKTTIASVALSALLAPLAPSQNPQTADLPEWRGPCYNCYNHALNRKDWFFAQTLDVTAPNKITCQNAKAAAIVDGLAPAAWPGPPAAQPAGWPAGACPLGHSLVALAVIPCELVEAIRKIPGNKFAQPSNQAFVGDFHWYRLNGDGTAARPFRWSHKPGQTPATDKDGRGRVMGAALPPHLADLGIYEFCCYMCVPNAPAALGPVDGSAPWDFLTGAKGYDLESQGREDQQRTIDPFQVLPLLPTPIPVPDPLWPDFEGPSGYGLGLPPIVPGLPPYLRVQDGIVAFYSDLAGDQMTQIQYFVDDHGLEDFLRAQFDVIEVDLFGFGCDSSTGPLVHTVIGGDGMVGGFIDYGVSVYDPAFPAVLQFGFASGSLPLGPLGFGIGCELLIDPIGSVPLFPAPPLGGGSFGLPIPPDPVLGGLELFTQGVVLDPLVPGGLALSNGAVVTIR